MVVRKTCKVGTKYSKSKKKCVKPKPKKSVKQLKKKWGRSYVY